jgi:hypothetical protein
MESDLRDRTIEPPTTDNRCVWVKVGQVPCDRHGPVELLCSTCKEKHPAPPPVAEWPADTPLALDAEAWEVES